MLTMQNKIILHYPPEYEARPIIKTEETTRPWGGAGDRTRKTTPFDPIQMANLQECYGCKPGATENEYLWRVCLTGGDRILLNGDEANGFWGLGVFLNAGPASPDDPHSITSRVAYWARGIDVLERGEPLLIPIKSLNELSTVITKAACIQAMHERDPLNVPISAIVDPDMLKPLIKGAPAMLKPYLIAKRDEIRRDANFNALLAIREAADNKEEALVQRNLPTWATLMHDILNHGREMGWDDLSGEPKKTSRNVRQLKQSTQDIPRVQEPTDHQSRTQKCRELYSQVLLLCIPRIAIQRQSASTIQSLVHTFQKYNDDTQKVNAPNTQTPTPPPRGSNNPFPPKDTEKPP
uniref:Uncharacterized protein n=1 Tax=Accipiter nisus TaxID=211598 RepID=A0A8B9NK43_9AVES